MQTQNTFNDDDLLTTDQVARITGISKQTFEGWRCRKNGGPPYRKLGTQIIRYRWADLRAWIDGGLINPNSAA